MLFLYQQHFCMCKKNQSFFSIIRYDDTQLWFQTRHNFAKSYCNNSGYCWWNVWRTNKNTSMGGTCMLWIIGGGARGPCPPPPPPHFWISLVAKGRDTLIEQSLTLIFTPTEQPSPLFLVFWAEVGPLAHWPTLPPMLWIVCQWFQILPWSSHANPVKDWALIRHRGQCYHPLVRYGEPLLPQLLPGTYLL